MRLHLRSVHLGSARGTSRADPNPLGPAPAVFDRAENIFAPAREARHAPELLGKSGLVGKLVLVFDGFTLN